MKLLIEQMDVSISSDRELPLPAGRRLPPGRHRAVCETKSYVELGVELGRERPTFALIVDGENVDVTALVEDGRLALVPDGGSSSGET